jgi:hypothetical protein
LYETDTEVFVDFLGGISDMDFLQKYLRCGFKLPLPRNAQKYTTKKQGARPMFAVHQM